MSSGDSFLDLSPSEKAVLLYVVGQWTQKELLKQFNVSYSEFSHARKELVVNGILETENTASEKGLNMVPTKEWIEILSSLRNRLERSQEETRAALTDNVRLKENISSLKAQAETLFSKILEQEKLQEESRDLNDLLCRFDSMGINVQWVRSVVALALIEAAMKRKLDQLGISIKPGVSFGELRNTLEQAVQDIEKRKLRPRLLGLSELSEMRNKIIHTGHLFVQLPKAEADALVDNVSDLLNEMLDFPGHAHKQK